MKKKEKNVWFQAHTKKLYDTLARVKIMIYRERPRKEKEELSFLRCDKKEEVEGFS